MSYKGNKVGGIIASILLNIKPYEHKEKFNSIGPKPFVVGLTRLFLQLQ